MDLANQVKWLQSMNERLIALNEQLVYQRSADQEERRVLMDLVRGLSQNLPRVEPPSSPPSSPRADLQEKPLADSSPESSSDRTSIPSGSEFQNPASARELSGLFMPLVSPSRKSSASIRSSSPSSKLPEFTDFEFFPEDRSKA